MSIFWILIIYWDVLFILFFVIYFIFIVGYRLKREVLFIFFDGFVVLVLKLEKS